MGRVGSFCDTPAYSPLTAECHLKGKSARASQKWWLKNRPCAHVLLGILLRRHLSSPLRAFPSPSKSRGGGAALKTPRRSRLPLPGPRPCRGAETHNPPWSAGSATWVNRDTRPERSHPKNTPGSSMEIHWKGKLSSRNAGTGFLGGYNLAIPTC